MAASVLDRFRLALSRWILSPLQGATLDIWWRALRENGFRVPPRFWPRALVTTAAAAANSLTARRERRRFEPAWSTTPVHAPVFVLGHYRSGTTHLHNLLAADGRFAFPDNYQASFPRTFLTTERLGKRVGAAFTMRRRPHDNVALDLDVPTEDELALCADTLLSPHMDWHFPRAGGRYTSRFLDFGPADEAERNRWVESLRTFARKLTLRYGRQLVFKSPLHTARIPLLLSAFPDARFVHVHRDPLDVFVSTRKMELAVEPLFRFQNSDFGDLDERILERYRRLYEAYLGDRPRLTDDVLVEVGYTELVAEPLSTLERIYGRLGLPDFEQARPRVAAYLARLGTYRRNRYPPLAPEIRGRVAREWGPIARAWGYEVTEHEGGPSRSERAVAAGATPPADEMDEPG